MNSSSDTRPPDLTAARLAATAHSRYLRQLLAARPEVDAWLDDHAASPLAAERMSAFLSAAAPLNEEELKRCLRHLRQRVMATLVVRDIGGLAPLSEVVETMTRLADVSTNFALDFLHRQLAGQFGEPLDEHGRPQRLLVIGMGKLGGRELNVSSDVDYIFVYPEEGRTAGNGRRLDNYEFFLRLGKRLIAALDDVTGDGQVFRVDMRLRPNGDSGPLVGSLGSLENYFIAQGREWERYAWIKARVMNEGTNLQPEWIDALQRICRPFVFRKYLDFGAINAMRDLHAQIRREVARRDMAEHIKLGPGGIREIEFIAQVFQLIRGGRDPALQVRPTLRVLALLAERRLLPAESERELATAYGFLRRLEHRLQYVADAQTHRLPGDDDERQAIATAMACEDWASFMVALDAHRALVARHFEQVFSEPEEGRHPLAGIWDGATANDDGLERLAALGFRQPQALIERVQGFRDSGRYLQLPASNRERLDALGPRLIDAAAATATPDATWQRGLDFLDTISRRGAYLALLQQYPQALKKLAELIGSSSWAADYLTRHPILLDELLDSRIFDVSTDWQQFRDNMQARLAEHVDDTEREMDILRETHHAQVFHFLAQDLAGMHTVEHLADRLSELADIMVQTTLDLCWHKLKSRHPRPELPPRFAVIAYGKLGGKELGFASDLDLVYLHDDPESGAGELYARLGQRMSTWMSSQTAAGSLFEVDLRLRPNGDSGMLVCPVDAFRDYQLQHAWVWEHQALTRARFCAGDRALGEKFEAIRTEILRQPRDLATLRREVLAMRQRMLEQHGSGSQESFDIKHDRGGLIDVEFIVQYLILGHAWCHARLCGNLGNIALLGIAADLGLIPGAAATAVRDAYREYRRMQHVLRLNAGRRARVERATVSCRIEAVLALWQQVFASP
ncbi:bifunctional [glutamate--ammonia ligase]-adenylyl-L-tyrosine phosphorylase/[glutamate--ammonia-ligase] adenylyltransferase [Accumulibacter sp.]|uniref:bifunctional [glutamate--ammonia ligase]-adenylyl-L-tyrosine phosphorylase/[glutamate--ammonia-ligase] adenylyltransferase n=1 Tax=Accumulibacter sp. TaxID=2053492 RepID=UPI0025D058E8|nr:bifunctional [glutamate--ammonia ligase]-adenylyl-L-tyrosine phosphorylase/[glutamate--ammonia-ligase] adenylyltransferase [Accumulibacter sp.]MCM8611599.1 bifunctional [glutamate--ammonia ligase]-adenylyl-L-tyrosine phosphorylase/[glutamate--ammonia-ligase] adenylyltransferase [Accumulibacter sp.]MCM8635631.1 bifunctional [glutamate--ammonia ligase]-adenylyl-L-tyrosine phosphorylase/[glutamate--ammonia-ligase] adenylyltransferase [Accumulibacter sp.]MCM8639306.1 bifunctional [glutamate--ammo